MNFDVKDVKSWKDRHDVKVGDIGFVACVTNELALTIATITEIIDDTGKCFVAQPLNANVEFQYSFFLPLDKVKEDKSKEKKYRPIKNMRELTDVVSGKDWTTAISTDEELLVRCKYNKHRIKVLITRLEFDNNLELVSINNKAPKVLLENYEVMSVNGNFMPFGVEVEDEY